ncbi:MAG TPA: cytochrome c-type biogenesis protein [Steroidobacteraceae bacterium]|nr:cytochrome c-type biogenesis protein [Steroidobacteraceae bacterium]
MSRWLVLVALALSSAGALAIDTEAAFPDPALQARYEHMIRELRCVQCQNQSIADSPVGLAADLRRQVKEMIAAGQTDADIKRYMTDRYGDFVLYDPPLRARTYVLWAAPALLVLITVGIAARVILCRSKAPIGPDPEEPA